MINLPKYPAAAVLTLLLWSSAGYSSDLSSITSMISEISDAKDKVTKLLPSSSTSSSGSTNTAASSNTNSTSNNSSSSAKTGTAATSGATASTTTASGTAATSAGTVVQAANRDDVRKYIEDVLAMAPASRAVSPTDPQINMLARVGEANIDLLLEAVPTHPRQAHYLYMAVDRLATANSKTVIVNALDSYPALIDCVVRNGWTQDAKPVLLAGLQVKGRYLPQAWIAAVARMQDPATYGSLLNFMIYSGNRYQTYLTIKDLPGIKIYRGTVRAAWQEQLQNPRDTWGKTLFALVAVNAGEGDALTTLIEAAARPQFRSWQARILAELENVTGFSGDAAAFRQWYQTHRAKLYFDEARGKFELKK